MKYFIYVVIALVAVSVVAGFFIVGSPQQERLRRFDERRVSDLQSLQSQILYYWQNKSKLPGTLVDLNDSLTGFSVPVDPQNGQAYVYSIQDPQSFQLCATFSIASISTNRPVSPRVPSPVTPVATAPISFGGQNWEHGAGYTCFTRNIDKDFFPTKSK